MARVADVVIQQGSRWRLRRGQHSGSIAEIVGWTEAGSVKYRNVGGGRSVGSTPYDDEARIHTKPADEFLTLFEPVQRGDTLNGTVKTQPRFRQRNVPKVSEGSSNGASNGLAHYAAHHAPEGLQVSVKPERITPALAREWLERGGENRRLNQKRVGVLVAAIRRGEWRLTGDTIKLDQDGKVRDGQHRLAAIAEAGHTVETLVVRNVQEEAFEVMDTGKARSIPDILYLSGFKDTNVLAATVRNLVLWEQTGRLIVTTRESGEWLTSPVYLDYLRKHADVIEGVKVGELVRKFLVGGPGLWSALFVLFARVDKEKADDFAYKLANGEGLERGNPILVLRNRLLAGLSTERAYFTTASNEKEALAAAVIKAWNAFRKGEPITAWSQLHWYNIGRRAEPFPRPDDLEAVL